MLSYSIETRVEKGKEIISRTVSNILSEQSMKIADIKTHLKEKGQYKAEMILSEKFESKDVFSNDNVTIQPQKWLLYTITLKD
jgi:uncharacterized protein YqcC (DUF446 family)